MAVQLDTRYQTEAYEAIQNSIKETRKAGIILPTGTGKTYLALKLIEDNLDKEQILYVSPSPTINVQVRKIIRANYSKEEAKKILSKIKFTTYTALQKRYKNSRFDMREYKSDIIILDEVHRSGAKEWGKAVDYLLEENKEAEILGMTATPLRNDGQNMIEKRCGKVAYELKISEAVARGVLTLPTYISSRYIFSEDIEDLQTKIDTIEDPDKKEEFQKKLNKLKKQVSDAKGIKEIINKHIKKGKGKYLLFCNPGDNIEELQEQAKQEGWFDEINENQTLLSVESINSDLENDMALRKFERKGGDDLRILYSKNMLNEGIHDEEITGEIMLRPTKSYILFIQQLGRILSKDRKEPPIVLDLVGNIKYFKEFRLEIKSIIKEGIARGDKRYSEKLLEQFRILEEQEDFIKAFEEIETSIEEYMNRTSISKTLEILESLKAEGIDVTKIQQCISENGKRRSTYLYEVEEKNIEEIIEKLNLDRNYPIGTKIARMLQAYKGNGRSKITETDRERIEALGLAKEKSAIEELLDILESLKAEGIDVTKIQQCISEKGKRRSTYLYEIQEANIEEIIEKLNLDRAYPIGLKITTMLQVYKGNGKCKITETDRERIEALGFVKEKIEKSATEELLDILESLKTEGIDVTKIQQCISENGKRRSTYLYEVEEKNIEEIIEKLNLDRTYPIGNKISNMLQVYKDSRKGKITETDRERIEALGLAKEKSAIEELLDILENLKKEGIDVTKIQQFKRKNGKPRSTYLYEVEEKNIEEIIEKLNLDRTYPIGTKIARMLQVYKGNGKCKITETDRERIEALGFVKEKREKSATEELLDILESLKAEGIDVTKIQKSIKENRRQRSTYLYEIQEANIEEIIEKLNLDGAYPIGSKIYTMLQAYKGHGKCKITETDRERIEELGLVSKLDKKVAEQDALRKKQEETKKLKAQVQEIYKQSKDKNIGDIDE